MDHMDALESDRISMARAMVMNYSGYSDESKAAWMEALDGLEDCRRTQLQNAREALEKAFKENLSKE
jgi:hypothetical protein